MKNFKHNIFKLLITICSFWILNPFVIGQQEFILDKAYKDKLLYSISDLIETKYVIPEVAQKSADDFRNKISSGYYDAINDARIFTEKVTNDLINITNDKHIHFRLIESSDLSEEPESSLHHPIRYHRLGLKENNGFSKLECLEGNIGLFELTRFYNYSDVKDMVLNAMHFLSNADAIIIDIRENGGGSGDYLSSYFLEHPTQLNSSYSRIDNYLTESWTLDDIGMEQMTDIPLYILTSDKTFSAAESFAYDMKANKRAIIIGDSTKGGAHSVDLYNLYDQFEIYIPTARAINPITRDNWEGIGVVPDVNFDAAVALDTAIVLAKRLATEYAKIKEEKLKSVVQEMQFYLDQTEVLISEKKIKEANKSLDSLLQIAKEFHIVNEFFFHVWAYHYSSIGEEQMLYAILDKYMEYYPNSIIPYEKYIYAYNKFGEKERALKYVYKTLDKDPDNQYALIMIERLQD